MTVLDKQKERQYPMRKPAGHEPVIQRYSSEVPAGIKNVHVAVFGVQSKSDSRKQFSQAFESLCIVAGKPLHHDFSYFSDSSGYENVIATCYWHADSEASNWQLKVSDWLITQKTEAGVSPGYWLERFSVAVDYRETIAFSDYIRGLSACPMSRMEPMNESGYWGAARDRFSASAYDDLSAATREQLTVNEKRDTLGKFIRVTDLPANLCVIRSGVSWAQCDGEQLASYQRYLEPKLDAGMEYLRQNPVESGCCSLRQVRSLDHNLENMEEGYSLGFFLSFPHLEDWSENHPTHLAIYSRALAERKKYQENLQLKTYHEIYVLDQDADFQYLNCHPHTGMLPYFKISEVA